MKKVLPASLLAVSLLAITAGLAATPPAPTRTMVVLDASGSMWGQIGGRPKIAIAREAVDSMLSGWSGGELGLMAYGHNRKGDCADIQVLQPVGPANAAAIRRQVDAINPKGMTPITEAVRQAAGQLRYTERKATVILVSDGEETCNADPCALGKELEQMGVDFTAHVVGFDIERGSTAHRQLQCLASNTGGRYIEAGNAAELNQALEQVATASTGELEGAHEWVPEHALVWVPGTRVEGLEDSGGTRSIPFRVGQTAQECQALCYADRQCAGWHYEPTGSYFVDHPRCFTKGHAAPLRLERNDAGWVAGVKPGVRIILEDGSELTNGGGMAAAPAAGGQHAGAGTAQRRNDGRNIVGDKAQRQADRQQQRAEDAADRATDRAVDKVTDRVLDKLFGGR